MKYLLPGIALLALSALLFIPKTKDNLLCPSQYRTAEASVAGFQKFSNDFYASHPNATPGDMLQARLDFYTSHHCTQELEAYKQADEGKADPDTMARIDAGIQESIKNQ
jgi:hypothetical protein